MYKLKMCLQVGITSLFNHRTRKIYVRYGGRIGLRFLPPIG